MAFGRFVVPAGAGSAATSSPSYFPGFDGLRLLAAGSVLFSHAFLMAAGWENDEPLNRLLGPGNIVGLYGVYTFFIISGFLLARSLDGNGSAAQFAINRALRIYPGFIFCILVTAVAIGPIGSSLAWRAYFAHAEMLGYVTTALSCLCDVAHLPGVYAYAGPTDLTNVVNGSLWSLPFEVLSYVLLVWLWVALRDIRAVALAFVLLAAATVASPMLFKALTSVSFTLPFFTGGVAMYPVSKRFGLRAPVALGCAACLVIAASFGVQRLAFAVFGAYLVVFLGSRPNVGSRIAGRIGDLSYGVYLFGWPVEQLVRQHAHVTNPWAMMAVAFPLAFALAAISCHLVERPALRLKTPIGRLVARLAATDDAERRRVVQLAASVAVLAAAGAILVSDKRWWYVTRAVGEVAMWGAAGALLGLLALASLRSIRGRSPG